MDNIGALLRKAREKKHITQIEAAKQIGISNGTLSGYERNYRDPDTATLCKLANLYEVSVDYLVTGRDPRKSYGQVAGPSEEWLEDLTEQEETFLKGSLELFRKVVRGDEQGENKDKA